MHLDDPDALEAAALAFGATRSWHRLVRQELFWLGVALLLFVLLFAFAGPEVYHRSQDYNVSAFLMPPSARYPLGTDALGRDNLYELMLGGRLPILTGFATAIGATLLGLWAGLSAALSRSLEGPVLRVADAILSIPQVVPIIIVESLLGANVYVLMGIVALTLWPSTARLIWTRAIVVREQPYVEAARASGAGRLRILLRHVLPNSFDTVLTCFATQFASAVLFIALATALGVGLPPPWNWATMISTSLGYAGNHDWWLVAPPGLMFSLLIVSVFLVTDAVRRAWNPRALGGGAP